MTNTISNIEHNRSIPDFVNFADEKKIGVNKNHTNKENRVPYKESESNPLQAYELGMKENEKKISSPMRTNRHGPNYASPYKPFHRRSSLLAHSIKEEQETEPTITATPTKTFNIPSSSLLKSAQSTHSEGDALLQTPLLKAVKPNPLAFRSTGFLSKKAKHHDFGELSNARFSPTPTPETPSKRVHSKILLNFTPQFQNSSISSKSSNSSNVFTTPHQLTREFQKEFNNIEEEEPVRPFQLHDSETIPNLSSSPAHTPMSHLNFKPMNSSSSSPPFDPQLAPESPNSPSRRCSSQNKMRITESVEVANSRPSAPSSIKSFSSPIIHDLSSEEHLLDLSMSVDGQFEDEDNGQLVLKFDQMDEDEKQDLIPSLLFSSDKDTSANMARSTSFVTFNNHLSMNFAWRSHYPHLLNREYFEHCESTGDWDINEDEDCEMDDSDYFCRHFDILEVIGRGSFADVFKVRCKSTHQTFAIKKTRHAFQGMKDRIKKLQEVRNMWLVCPHPHILEITQSWEQFGCLYIQMELCENGTLENIIENVSIQQGYFDETEIWTILRQVGTGLQHIHLNNLLHLDLKPANILVDQNGNLKIGDFGLSTLEENLNNIDSEGDKYYMAPEVLKGQYGKPADVFSFGLIALELAANIVLPSQGDEWRNLRQGRLDFIPFEVQRSRQLLSLVERMIHPDPSLRVQMDEVLFTISQQLG